MSLYNACGFLRGRKRWDCIQAQCTQSTVLSRVACTSLGCPHHHQSVLCIFLIKAGFMQFLGNKHPFGTESTPQGNSETGLAQGCTHQHLRVNRRLQVTDFCHVGLVLGLTRMKQPRGSLVTVLGQLHAKKNTPCGLPLVWPSSSAWVRKAWERSILTYTLSLYHGLLPKDVLCKWKVI